MFQAYPITQAVHRDIRERIAQRAALSPRRVEVA